MTNSHISWVDLFLKPLLGPEWRDLFDICLVNCNKPLFYKAEACFVEPLTELFLSGHNLFTVKKMEEAYESTKTFLRGNAL